MFFDPLRFVELINKLPMNNVTMQRPGPAAKSDDGTRALLYTGIWTLVAGVVATLLTATVFGGISRQGPHTNAGWLSLMVAMMCLPFGGMLFALGGAKWLRNRRLRRGP
jgi:drug/metabolite transporter (DMT)-like permease